MSDLTHFSGDEFDTPRSRPDSVGSSNRGFFRGL